MGTRGHIELVIGGDILPTFSIESSTTPTPSTFGKGDDCKARMYFASGYARAKVQAEKACLRLDYDRWIGQADERHTRCLRRWKDFSGSFLTEFSPLTPWHNLAGAMARNTHKFAL